MAKNKKQQDKNLKALYYELIELTINHDVIRGKACVTADKLGRALSKVNPYWYTRDRGKL